MLDEAAMAIVTGAAGSIVASILSDRLEAVRARLARMFHSGGEEHRLASALRALEDDRESLAAHDRSAAEVNARWIAFLAAYLATAPDGAEHLQAIAAIPTERKQMTIGSQNNYGSGTFIGGDNYGTVPQAGR